MKGTVKLLATVVIILVIIAGAETYLLTAVQHQPESKPVRIACIGDSITRGTEYTLDLWAQIGPEYIIGDFGIGGATVSLQSEAAYMNKKAFQTAKDFQPDLVFVMLGTNDADLTINETIDEFVEDYLTLLAAVESVPTKPEIYLLMPPPIYNTSLSLSCELLGERVQPGIRQVAAQTGFTLIDTYTPFLDHPELFVDGVHPTAEGAQKIAEAVYSAVSWPVKNV
jgi:acyl-CoA thioesterase-1